MNRLITVELCQRHLDGCSVKEWRRVPAAEARELLSKKTVNGYFYRVSPPDTTGAVPNDNHRYRLDLAAVA